MQIEDLQIILRVAQLGSITAAANSLDMRTATASAAVKRVETMLGVELFIRSTRKLRVSAAGERFLPQCEKALQVLEHAKQNIKEDNQDLKGEIRIAVSSDLGRNIILPWLDDFMEQHADISLRISISDSNIDFYRDDVDMALRYGQPKDSKLVGFKVCDIHSVVCAAPSYLQEYGEPTTPNDLERHNGLFYQLSDRLHDVWLFERGDETFRIKLKGNRASNDGDLVRRWCVGGKGIAVKSCLDVSQDLLQGRLQRLIPEYKYPASELWLVCPSRHSITPAIRVLRDYLKTRCNELVYSLQQEDLI